MVDLSGEIADLWASLGAPGGAGARVIQLVAAREGEGASTVARELAYFAARRAGRSVWLVDLDILAGAQFLALSQQSARYGALGEAAAASPDGSIFYTVRPPGMNPDGTAMPDARYLSAHRVGDARWWVTRFRTDALGAGQNLHILPRGEYWSTLKRHADLIIVDAPPMERSSAALTVAPYVDQTVLVVSADQADISAPARLRDRLVEAGGVVAGLFLNRMGASSSGSTKSDRW